MLFLALISVSFQIEAQEKKAELDVYGLTCSMCSRNVEMAVSKLDFVKKIDVDLENAVFELSFNNNPIKLNKVFQAVHNAGFSVGSISLPKSIISSSGICLDKTEKTKNLTVKIVGYHKKKKSQKDKSCKYIYEVIDNS